MNTAQDFVLGPLSSVPNDPALEVSGFDICRVLVCDWPVVSSLSDTLLDVLFKGLEANPKR